MTLDERVNNYTSGLHQKGLLRTRVVSRRKESDMIYFDSSDYLSLNQNSKITTAYQEGFKLFPSGSSGSMVLSGYHENHREVERAFADLLDVDDCILFTSGYAANLALTALLGRLKATCFIDRGVHASIYDGLAQAGVAFIRYAHNNMADLSIKHKSNDKPSALICEGIYSMSGQLSPLSTIFSMCEKQDSALLVDEAHSFGILGHNGRGAVDHHQLTQKEVPLRTIAFGKAFASQGALIAGQKNWINALLQAGRSLVYSTAISPALSYGLLKTLDVVVAADDRRSKLYELIELFKECIAGSPLQWADSSSAIQQLQLGCPKLALHYAHELRQKGIACSAIRSPTVSTKATGLRIILNFNHDLSQIKQLFNELNNIYEHQHK